MPTIFNHRQLANFVTAVITWVHYFKSVIKIQNNICLIKHDRSPEVANDSTKQFIIADRVQNFGAEGQTCQNSVPPKCSTKENSQDIILK